MKKLEPFGIAGRIYETPHSAAQDTYSDSSGNLPSTPLIFPDNPFNDDVATAKVILDLGCGIGRNLSWIMENTNAHYIGLDPNPSMLRFFWTVQDVVKYGSRVTLYSSFDQIPADTVIDVVVVTFVFQHIGFRPNEAQMNVSDITKNVRRFTTENTVWIMYEHEWEEKWAHRWMVENGVQPVVYEREYAGIPELTHRGLHDLIIWQG